MAKRRNVMHLTLNVTIMVVLLCSSSKAEWEASWSSNAAEEMEAVAAIPCSGHGRAYLDGLVLNGIHPLCECNQCYTGSNCSKLLSDCALDVRRADLYFLEPFWIHNAASSAVLISGWHRMGYTYNDGSYISRLLVKHIQKLHEIAGNAVTDGRYIVFGTGSTQLLSASVHALSSNSSLPPAKVVATTPYFPIYRTQTQLFNSKDYRFEGDTSSWKNTSDSTTRFIEFVASPNNPDGKLTKGVLRGPNVKTIYDHAFYWPHFTPIPSPSNEDIMVFTISKLTGHAGSRFGWAIIKDEAIYEKMLRYLDLNSIGVCRDTQLRVLKLVDVVLEGDGREMFQIASQIMKDRWTSLQQIMSKSKHFSLQKLSPHYCTFFNRIRDSSPANAWLKCEREEDTNCDEILKNVGIRGLQGNDFGADNRYVRLSLTGRHDDFQILITKLQDLLAKE